MNFGEYLPYIGEWGSGNTEVAIVDSGVSYHELLDAKIIETGYDYVDTDEDSRNDLFGHGTHVAGIVADCTYNMPVYIFPIRVLNAAGGGKMSNVVHAACEATAKGVDVINLSIESRTVSAALDDAITEALNAGITVVCAAGNSSCNTSEIYPAHMTEKGMIVVGSAEMINGDVARASYSNFGESVDVYAFGSKIVSCSRSGGYVADTGTSMATPHITALAAMLRLLHPGLEPENIEDRIIAGCTLKGGLPVPDLQSMVPETEGFYLHTVTLDLSETLQLPTMAFPASACEEISYESSDDTVVGIAGGILTPNSQGEAVITAYCTGFPVVSFDVNVISDSDICTLSVPSGVRNIEDEAFYNLDNVDHVIMEDGVEVIGNDVFDGCESLRTIVLPPSVSDIGRNTFSGAVVLCEGNSTVAGWLRHRSGVQYIIEAC